MRARYSRAAGWAPPKIAATTPGVAVEGYWLDERSFFFLAERFDTGLGRILTTPSIASAVTGVIEEIFSLETLASLLTAQSGEPVDIKALADAVFDMPDPATLAVTCQGRDYLIDREEERVVAMGKSFEQPALYSPDGQYACFVKDHDLWLRERHSGMERPLTTEGATHHAYGQHSETALSAVAYRKCPSPMGLWSPDSQWFLTHRIDERTLPDLPLIQHAPREGGRPVLHRYKYPLPGDPLPVATYVAIHAACGRVIEFDEFPVLIMAFLAPFFVRHVWFSEPDRAWFLRYDRHFKQAELVCLDLEHGTGRVVLRETTVSGYLDPHPILVGTPNVRTLPRSDEVIWFSERDGWGHLYLYEASTGRLKNQITRGAWLVRDIVHVDEAARQVLLLAGGVDPAADPARRSLCRINFDGSGFEVLLVHEGDVYLPITEPGGLGQERAFRPSNARAGLSPDGRFGVARYASLTRGNLTKIVEMKRRDGFTIASAEPLPGEITPRAFTTLAADGTTRLHGVMFMPADFAEHQRYPLIDFIYPGPQVAHQPQSFRSVNAALAQGLAELGFITIMLDTRGTPIGSRGFHQAGYPRLLEPQLADHAAAVRQLGKRFDFIDAERVGMIGWSGGGFATARALFDYGDVFKVGVSACGNHDSDLYTALWSDKYRGPKGSDDWIEPPNTAIAGKLQGKLLLICSDMDENVPISQTLALVDALTRANRDFDLLIVPNAGHDVLMTHGYALRRAWDYLVRHLLGEAPPVNFQIELQPHELLHYAKNAWREVRQ
jgi:dipeptidyl aminopeptidase/acylaminoacyl peptidase